MRAGYRTKRTTGHVPRFTHYWLLILIILGSQLSARAQEPRSREQDEPVRLKSDLVTVSASVIDPNGRAIKSLKPEDFTIYEDGVRQKIAHFAATEEPFTLLLVLDLSGSTRDDISLIKRAARNFLGELRFDDRVGVIVFSREIEMISEFTDPRAEVLTAIDRVATPAGEEGHRFTTNTGTSFYDALYLAVEESPLKQTEGRKAIVCMSDGVDSTSKMKFANVMPLAEQSGASIYFLELNTEQATLQGLLKPKSDPDYVNFSQSQIDRYYAEHDPESIQRFRPRTALSPETTREINAGLYETSRRELRSLGERTGGRVYALRSLSDLAGVYKQVADDLHAQYSIAYYPSNNEHDGRWRAIKVTTRAQNATVRARSGYRAK
ncbi:MAG TPA: VWA domain-containing protein [Blastocatellia bacterium]|nr:VWA domain-containing protein [Blastocatellia bacterium]